MQKFILIGNGRIDGDVVNKKDDLDASEMW